MENIGGGGMSQDEWWRDGRGRVSPLSAAVSCEIDQYTLPFTPLARGQNPLRLSLTTPAFTTVWSSGHLLQILLSIALSLEQSAAVMANNANTANMFSLRSDWFTSIKTITFRYDGDESFHGNTTKPCHVFGKIYKKKKMCVSNIVCIDEESLLFSTVKVFFFFFF